MKVKWFLAIVLVIFVFLDSIYLPFDFGFDFRLQYVVFLVTILLYPFISRINVRPSFLLLAAFILLFLLITPLLVETPIWGPVRQVILIFICLTPFYFMFSALDFSYLRIFNLYLFFSYLISLAGVIQFFSMLIHFKPGYDFSYLGFDMSRVAPDELRIQSWMLEPSFLVYILTPALFYSLVRIFGLYKTQIIRPKVQCFLVIVAVLLTRSLLGYLSVLLIGAIIFFTRFPIHRSPVYSFVLLLVLFGFAAFAFSIPALKLRIVDTFKVFSGANNEITSANLSTQHFYDNYRVAIQSIKERPLSGVGLGNYHVMYEKLPHSAPKGDLTPDGASLFFRMITETGMLFTLLAILLTFHLRVRLKFLFSEQYKDLWIISNGIFVFLVMRWIRFPHYTAVGLAFFLMLYYISFNASKLSRRQSLDG